MLYHILCCGSFGLFICKRISYISALHAVLKYNFLKKRLHRQNVCPWLAFHFCKKDAMVTGQETPNVPSNTLKKLMPKNWVPPEGQPYLEKGVIWLSAIRRKAIIRFLKFQLTFVLYMWLLLIFVCLILFHSINDNRICTGLVNIILLGFSLEGCDND